TAAILRAAADGRIAVLMLVGADPLADFPDRELVMRALAGAGFVISVDTFVNASTRYADVVLPAAAYAERSGTTTNLEGRVSRVAQKIVPPGVAWPDWLIAAELASKAGGDLGFGTVEEITDEIARLVPTHAGLTRAALADRANRDGVVPPSD